MTMSTKVAIIGSGSVGKALFNGLQHTSYEVRTGGRGKVAETAAWADIIVLAVPYAATINVALELESAADGKTVVDVTNALTADMQLAVGSNTSGAEELQKALPRAHVVKAFNTVLAKHMENGNASGRQLSAFCAGDDETARNAVIEMAHALGFDGINAGPLKNARSLEPLAYLIIQLGFVLGYGADLGIKLVH
jgi:predicted dinucleotide-binding enzyme